MKALIIILFASTVLKAAEAPKVYFPKEGVDIPAEISLILRGLSPENLTPPELAKLNGFATNFSRYTYQLTKPDLYFVVKTEIAKVILSSRPDRSTQYRTFNSKRINEIEAVADWPAYSPWAQFAFRSLLKDAKTLVADARFPSLWSLASPQGGNSQDMAILRKRVELVLSWIDYFAFTAVASVNEKFDNLAFKALGRIERAAWILTTLSKLPDAKSTESIFELKALETKEAPKTAQEILNNVVDPLVETGMPKLPEPVNDWLPREIPTGPTNSATIIKKKDPFYSAPASLPKPTNDWIMSL